MSFEQASWTWFRIVAAIQLGERDAMRWTDLGAKNGPTGKTSDAL